MYPADYGFVPDTLAEDGDPLDVLVLLDEPTFPGCYVDVRAIGVFWMRDDKGPDNHPFNMLENLIFQDLFSKFVPLDFAPSPGYNIKEVDLQSH